MVIHILAQGLPVCGFSKELPCNWPIGHKWVRFEDHKRVDCQRCREAMAQAIPPPEEPAPPTLPSPATPADVDWAEVDWGGYV